MKSTIKKAYDRRVEAEGTLVLSYKANKNGANGNAARASAIGVLLLFVFGPISGLVGYLLGAFVGVTFFVLSVYLLNKKFFGKRNYEVKISHEGVIFNNGKDFAAHKDIAGYGVVTETESAQHLLQLCYVYADIFGNRVNLTGYVEQGLADTLCKEIVNYQPAANSDYEAKVAA